MSNNAIPDEGVGGGTPPPSGSPPTTTGGWPLLRFTTPNSGDETWLGEAHYNFLDADRPCVFSGCLRYLGKGLSAFAFGLCGVGQEVLWAGAVHASDFVGFVIDSTGTLSFVCRSTTTVLGTLTEGAFYTFGFKAPPLRGTSFRVYVNDNEYSFSATLPSATLGMAPAVCASRLSAGTAFLEAGRLFYCQDSTELPG